MTENAETRYVGLDVHKREVTYCIIDAAGTLLEQRKFALDAPALHRFAQRTLKPGDHAVLESTTNCWAVAEILRGYVARVVVWRMLVANEPYRYAPPRSTADKLAKLRVAVTGQKRSSGPQKGVQAAAKLPGGSRTIKSIDAVYESEGLPPRSALSPGELRHVAETETVDFVDKIGAEHVVPRKRNHTANAQGKQTPQRGNSKKLPACPLQR